MIHPAVACTLAAGALFLAASRPAAAQEMEPRAYAPNPVGATYFLATFARSTGGVLTDPSLPVDDVEADVDSFTLGLGHTFGLFGRLASVTLAQPRASGHFTGTLGGEDAEASRSGLADTRLKFTVNLAGAPALDRAAFARRTPRTTLGASLTVSAPTGDYRPQKLVNVGSNRWAVKPEVGLSHPAGPWTLEAIAGVWLFGDNDEFFGGQRREQEPLASVQGHVAYTIRPRLWLALNATYYDGGRSTVGGVRQDDRQSNSRYGLTFSMPLSSGQSLKLHWNDGASTRIGSDFTTWGVTWQYTHLR